MHGHVKLKCLAEITFAYVLANIYTVALLWTRPYVHIYILRVRRYSLQSSVSMGSMELKTRWKIFSPFSIFLSSYLCRYLWILRVSHCFFFVLPVKWFIKLRSLTVSLAHLLVPYFLYSLCKGSGIVFIVLLLKKTRCISCTLVNGPICYVYLPREGWNTLFPAHFLQKEVYLRRHLLLRTQFVPQRRHSVCRKTTVFM
jgi:hypothetical protein